MRMNRLRVFVVGLLFAAACGGGGENQPPSGVVANKPALLAQDGSLCAARALQVYYRPAGPGWSAGCVCAGLFTWDKTQNPVTAQLELLFPDGIRQITGTIQQGSGVGRWNLDWASVGCP